MSPKSKTGKDIKDQMTALERARKQNVAKRNDMIQKSKKSLSIVENKAVSYIFSKVKPDDDPDTIYTFDCQEFYRLLRWKKESYTDLRAMLYSIASQTFGIIDEETGTEKIVHWFNTIHLKMSKSGKIVSDSKLPGRFVESKIHEDLMEYVFGLEQQRRENHIFYSAYQLQNVSMLTHTYSQPMYELLKSYENVGKWRFEYGTGSENDIQMRICLYEQEMEALEAAPAKGKGGRKRRKTYGAAKLVPVIPSSWSTFHFFERDVLKPVMKEINKYTDIEFSYEPSKVDMTGVKRRKYSTITFFIRKKTPAQKKETDKIIDDAYKDFDDGKIYKQMNLDDFLDTVTVDSEEAARIQEEEQRKKEKKRDKDIEKAEFKIAASCYYDDFKQKEIQHLVEAALKHLSPLRVRRSDREMWAIDFIDYYYNKIKATEEETRTTPYRRLLDCVMKDYENFAARLTTYDDPSLLEDDVYTESREDFSEATGAGSPISAGDGVSEENTGCPADEASDVKSEVGDTIYDDFTDYEDELPFPSKEASAEENTGHSDEELQPVNAYQEATGSIDLGNMTAEELDLEIERMKKLIELAEMHMKVKRNE